MIRANCVTEYQKRPRERGRFLLWQTSGQRGECFLAWEEDRVRIGGVMDILVCFECLVGNADRGRLLGLRVAGRILRARDWRDRGERLVLGFACVVEILPVQPHATARHGGCLRNARRANDLRERGPVNEILARGPIDGARAQLAQGQPRAPAVRRDPLYVRHPRSVETPRDRRVA